MNSKYIDELNNKLDKLIVSNQLKNKFIVVFGVNKPAEKTILYLRSKNVYVDAIVDNNKDKSGKKLFGITIYTPKELLSKFKENAVILIASQYYNEMKNQLEKMTYKEEINIFQIIKYQYYTVEEKYFDKKVSEVFNGYEVFEKIQMKYGKEKYIVICPYRGIGDIYFICSYIQEYLNKNNIEDYIFTVIGNVCKRITNIFNINNVEVLDQNQSDSLVSLYTMVNKEENIVKVLSHDYVHTDILKKFEVSNQLSWGELFKNCVMGLDNSARKTNPVFSYRTKYIKNLFRHNKLLKGKTVILSPYANTIVRLADGFWEKIVEQLIEKGYCVCTNSVGVEEPPIPGTVSLKFSLEDAVAVVEYAGVFIGIRSGFCDLISSAKAKKIVLYPNKDSLFFNIKNMGLSNDVIEVLNYSNEVFTLEKII